MINVLSTEYEQESRGWKMLGILIGANDICHSCYETGHSPDDYEQDLRTALRLLQKNAPKMIVNLYSLFRISEVYATEVNPYCDNLQKQIHECDCSRTPEGRICKN